MTSGFTTKGGIPMPKMQCAINWGVGFSLGIVSISMASPMIEIHAMTGWTAAGGSPGETFRSFDVPLINANGHLAFRATVDGPNLNLLTEQGVWAGTPGNISQRLRIGSNGLNGIFEIVQNESNQVALTGFQNTRIALYRASPGQTPLVLQPTGTSVAFDGGSASMLSAGSLYMRSDGTVLADVQFGGSTIGGTNGLMLGSASGARVVLRSGLVLPEPNSTATGDTVVKPYLLDNGTIFHKPSVAAAMIVRDVNGTLNTVTKTYDPQGGPLVEGDVYQILGFGAADDGSVVYGVNVQGRQLLHRQLRRSKGGLESVIAIEGGELPGFADTTIVSLAGNFTTNRNGDILSGVSVRQNGGSTTSAMAVFDQDGGVRLVCEKGAPAPGLPGLTFATTGSISSTMNENGEVAFLSPLTGTGSMIVGHALYFADAAGMQHLLLNTGEQIDVDPSPFIDLRTVSKIQFVRDTSAGSGAGYAFNGSGQLAAMLGFTDGSTAIATLSIPEPATAVTLVSGFALLARRPRSRQSR